MENVGSVDQPALPSTDRETGRETNGGAKRPRVRCEVCGKVLARLTVEHLRGHGLTRERYRRIYTALRDPTVGSADQSLSGSPDQPPMTTVDKLARRIAGSAAFLDTLSSEVADHILHAAPLRTQIAFAAAQVIQARMAIHADAVGRLSAISDELGEDWRVLQGGPNGSATPTKDLVSMAMQAHAEIVKAEEMVLKSAKLALEEQKAQDATKAPTFAFSGAAETVAIPKDLSPADREGLRALMGNLTKYVDARRDAQEAITVPATPVIATTEGPDQSPEDTQEVQGQGEGGPGGALKVTTTAQNRPRRRRRRKRAPGEATDPVIRRADEPSIQGGVSDSGGAASDGRDSAAPPSTSTGGGGLE
jgi:hypothetical protein